MKILFLGDSITEGIPGVSFVSMIQENCSEIELVNRGQGGDTVSSLFKRVKKMSDLSFFDQIVLFVGVNDVFGKLTNTYKILKTLTKQRWAKDASTFKKQYMDLITFIMNENKNIIVIPPVLIGEDINNIWNIELIGLIEIINGISIQADLTYLDIHDEFKEYLKDKRISDYLPKKINVLLKDVKRLTESALVDQKSMDRGLHLTLDGVHINSNGAKIISEAIINYVSNLNAF